MQPDDQQKPPNELKSLFKKFQKMSLPDLETENNVLDPTQLNWQNHLADVNICKWASSTDLSRAFAEFKGKDGETKHIGSAIDSKEHIRAYEPKAMPGLFILPCLIPSDVQAEVLARLFHRDLQDSRHKTNLHLHYDVVYPSDGQSFFSIEPSAQGLFNPKDPGLHKPLDMSQVLSKKLRWMTLGGQYDWTSKEYPSEQPPKFPSDLGNLLHTLFPQTEPEAAIVNLYSPGDTLSLHRDVSEDCSNGLISLSIGCDAVFVIGLEQQDVGNRPTKLVIRLHSGDVLYMTGAARYAWHGVPKIIPDTCPTPLQSWPCYTTEFADDSNASVCQAWQGWLRSKRININVRQMKDEHCSLRP